MAHPHGVVALVVASVAGLVLHGVVSHLLVATAIRLATNSHAP